VIQTAAANIKKVKLSLWEVRGQFHTLAALSLGKELLIPTGQEAG